jgi:hypothetical protein
VAADADVTVARERHKLAAAFSKETGGRADKNGQSTAILCPCDPLVLVDSDGASLGQGWR